ncbi:hypothetical protein [Marinimicrobium sp. C2-29]|uniref:hypothetical protein n=1 Tax=Marinimicrobium sp. C2-29 TaxID=3139825 RepID=UPI003139CA34
MDKALISFFDVKECGLYRCVGGDHKHIEGSLGQVARDFYHWVKDRDFSQTIPWDVTTHPKRPQIYCKNIARDNSTGDVLMVLWKRFGDDSGHVTGISPDAKVEQDSGDSIKIDPKVDGQSAILGQPMYYWFIPSLNIIATINFGHSSAATKDVCLYIKRCIDYRINHPRKVVKESDIENPLTGKLISKKTVTYKTEDEKHALTFRLEANTKELNSDKASAAILAQKISHIVVRDTISTEKKDDKDPVFELWSKVRSKKKYSKRIEIIEEAELSTKQVAEIIKVHHDEYDPSNFWNDIGFKEVGSETTKWFSRYVTREQIRLPILKGNQNYHSAATVLSRVLNLRDDLLQQILHDNQESGVKEAVGEK